MIFWSAISNGLRLIVSHPKISGGHLDTDRQGGTGSAPHVLGRQAERITIRCPARVDRLCSTSKSHGPTPARTRKAQVLPQRKRVARQYAIRLPDAGPHHEHSQRAEGIAWPADYLPIQLALNRPGPVGFELWHTRRQFTVQEVSDVASSTDAIRYRWAAPDQVAPRREKEQTPLQERAPQERSSRV